MTSPRQEHSDLVFAHIQAKSIANMIARISAVGIIPIHRAYS